MDKYELSIGEGRVKVSLSAYHFGDGLVVSIYNEKAHIGAVAVGEYDHTEQRASCSVITRLGHKDDVVACEAAHTIAKSTRRPVCAIAGIHLDDITPAEIETLVENARDAVTQLCQTLETGAA